MAFEMPDRATSFMKWTRESQSCSRETLARKDDSLLTLTGLLLDWRAPWLGDHLPRTSRTRRTS